MKLRVLLFSLVCMLLVTSCANPGTPDGGPYDEEPPRIIGSTPVYGQIGSKNAKIQIFFNELVQLENATEKVVVSPPQLEMPEIASKGKYIEVKLSDSLKSNTTYSIDFSDAIIDNNEGNPLGNYAFVFSTGENIDTMEVAGTVLNAANLEPVKGILVGLHEDMADTVYKLQAVCDLPLQIDTSDFALKRERYYVMNEMVDISYASETGWLKWLRQLLWADGYYLFNRKDLKPFFHFWIGHKMKRMFKKILKRR